MATAGKLTADELTELVGHMTAGDFWRFTDLRGNDQVRAMLQALHGAAQRTGRANGEAIDVFLDRVEIGELLRIVSGGGVPLAQAGGAGLPTSADTGE